MKFEHTGHEGWGDQISSFVRDAFKLRRLGCGGVLVIFMILGAIYGVISSFFPSDESRRDAEVKSLIARDDKLSSECQNSAGDLAQTNTACDAAQKLAAQLRAKGMCWGHSGQIEADKEWEPCGTALQQTATETSPKKADDDAVQFDPDAARGKEMLEELFDTARSCMYDVAKAQLMIGNKSRSDIITKMMNVCGNQYLAGLIAFRSTKWGAKQEDAKPEQIDFFLRTLANREFELASQQ